MDWKRHIVRLVIEFAIAWICVWIITFAVMNTMFYFGPWADPPWIDEGHRTLMSIAAVLCLWRAYRRLTVDMQARRCDGSG